MGQAIAWFAVRFTKLDHPDIAMLPLVEKYPEFARDILVVCSKKKHQSIWRK
jgi:hypothetical protein